MHLPVRHGVACLPIQLSAKRARLQAQDSSPRLLQAQPTETHMRRQGGVHSKRSRAAAGFKCCECECRNVTPDSSQERASIMHNSIMQMSGILVMLWRGQTVRVRCRLPLTAYDTSPGGSTGAGHTHGLQAPMCLAAGDAGPDVVTTDKEQTAVGHLSAGHMPHRCWGGRQWQR